MKKIGIITIPDYNNYGNRLQNYAVKHYFEDKGYHVDTLELNDILFPQYRARQLKLCLKKYRLTMLTVLFEVVSKGCSTAQRYLKFENFSRENLNTRYFPNFSTKNQKKVLEEYEYIVLGSDQIWHPTVNTTPNLFFATFVPNEKKIFFAPSFGVDEIGEGYKQDINRYLSGVKKISVREQSGKAILDEILNINATVLCDPTLCVPSEAWKKLAQRPRHIPEKYILSYFLGPRNAEYNEVHEHLKAKTACEIYKIGDKGKKELYVTGPGEFLYSILNAEVVITDSFHAVVFSLIFNKPFIVCSRLNSDGSFAGLDSRVDTLLESFGKKHCKLTREINLQDAICMQTNYNHVFDILKKQVDEYFKDI